MLNSRGSGGTILRSDTRGTGREDVAVGASGDEIGGEGRTAWMYDYQRLI